MEPFAEIDDLEAGWRKLTPDESEVAETLLGRASDKLRGRVKIRVGDEVQEANLKTVACDMVRRAMSERNGPFGLSQPEMGWEPMNTAGNIEPTERELKLLRSGGARAYCFWPY